MNGKIKVDGREEQRHKSVGKDEEGKKDGRSGRVRRATFDDLKAIIDINDNVYGGSDYMPALFYAFMHSKLHVIYVHEEDGKLVSLYNCRFHPDCDDLVSGLSGRVRPSYQGRGFGTADSSPLLMHVLQKHPTLRRFVGDTPYTPNIAAKMKKWKLLYHWVSLYNGHLHPDCDDLVSGLSGRVRPSYQGRGLGSSDNAPLRTHLLKEHPTLRRVVGDTMYTPNIAAKMKRWKLLYHWNILTYKLADRQWLSRFTSIREKSLGAVLPFSLSYTKGTEWLERSDQLVRFVSKYVVDLFPVGPTWLPTQTNKSGLRHALSIAKVFVSLDPASTIDHNFPSDLDCSRLHIQDEDLGLQRPRDRGLDGAIIGLSCSTVVPCKYGMKLDIFFYGDCEIIFLSHVYSQLHHYASITSDDVGFGVLLHFPLTIDSKIVEERLKEEMGERLCNDTFRVTQAVQYIAEIDRQAKL